MVISSNSSTGFRSLTRANRQHQATGYPVLEVRSGPTNAHCYADTVATVHGRGRSRVNLRTAGRPPSAARGAARSRGGHTGAAACPELRAAVAHKCAEADRTQVADGTGAVGRSRVATHKRTGVARNRVVADRTW